MTDINDNLVSPLPTWRPAVGTEDELPRSPTAVATRVRLAQGQQVWFLSGYDICRLALLHPDLRSDHTHPNYPDVFPIQKTRENKSLHFATYSGMDHPEHTLHRHLIAKEFSYQSVERWSERVQLIAKAAVRSMLTPGTRRADLVSQFAEPIASTTIFEFLGVPCSWRPEMARDARVLLGTGSDRQSANSASKSFRARLNSLMAEKEAGNENDLLGRLVARYRRDGLYSRPQLIEFAGALVVAAHQTATTAIALSVATLIERPAARYQMLADRSVFSRGVEELLRYLSVADLATARVATADVDLGGVHVRKGEGVIASTAHANYDVRRFVDAEILDIHRERPRHLAFGYGAHKCLGQHLARLELEASLRVLFEALPDVRLEDVTTLKFRRDGAILAAEEVIVNW